MTYKKKGNNPMAFNHSRFAMTVLASAISMYSVSAYANQTLTTMNVAQTNDTVTQLRLNFDEAPGAPQAYQLENPTRLVLDFQDVDNGLTIRNNIINQGAITDVTALNDDTRTRLVIGLKDPEHTQIGTISEGNSIVVNFVNTAGLPASNLQVSPTTIPTNTESDYPQSTVFATPSVNPTANNWQQPVETTAPAVNLAAEDTMVVKVNPLLDPAMASASGSSYKYYGLNNIHYNGTPAAGGTVNIGLANENIPVDIQRQGNKIVMRMTGANVPLHLVQQQNYNGGLVSSINARNNGSNGVVTIAMSEDFEYQAYQSGSQVNISIKPAELLRPLTLEEKQYTGQPLSVDFQNVEIRSVLHLLSKFTEMNIVASDSVTGNITLNLINVPWDQALDIILKSKNLGMRANGNVILVAPAAELAAQEAQELESLQKVQDFLPLRTEYIRLSYAKASDIKGLILSDSNIRANSTDSSASLLSDRGAVAVDSRTNTLIVKDTSESIENIRALIAKIDIPVRQVMIEARIVKATDNFSKELGVRWGILSPDADRDVLVSGKGSTLDELRAINTDNKVKVTDGLSVDLGAASATSSIAFGLLNMSDLMIDLELSAMQADGRGEVISSPRILTMDKQTAKVASGTQIAYQEATASGATSTKFVEAALSLETTPSITPDGKISLELNIENGSPVIYNSAVAINKDSLMTNVTVEDGQTVVLGGIYTNAVSEKENKVPFLGDLPVVGRLFKNDVTSNNKSELLIFVTPKLITDGISRYN